MDYLQIKVSKPLERLSVTYVAEITKQGLSPLRERLSMKAMKAVKACRYA